MTEHDVSKAEKAETARSRQLAPGHAFEAIEWREVASEETQLTMEMDVTPRVVNSAGALQGGLLATLVDMVAGSLLMRIGGPEGRYVTSELHLNFLAPARRGPVHATASVLRRGRRSAVVRVEVYDRSEGDRHVASATLTFAALAEITPSGKSEGLEPGHG